MYRGVFFWVVFKQTYGFMLNRSRTATLALHSRLRLRSVKSFSLVQVMWTRSGPLSALSFIVAWDAVFLSWMSWAWKGGRDKGEEIGYYPGDISGGGRDETHWTEWKERYKGSDTQDAKEGRNDERVTRRWWGFGVHDNARKSKEIH